MFEQEQHILRHRALNAGGSDLPLEGECLRVGKATGGDDPELA
jgi:hypothetical protein